MEAIKLMRSLKEQGRTPTPEQRTTLLSYVGWGGLPQAFDPRNDTWKREYAELKELLSEDEFEKARGSTLNAHYTSLPVVRVMWEGLHRLGIRGGRFLEPSAGIGHFIGGRPGSIDGEWHAVELDEITGQILQTLYAEATVQIQGFETVGYRDGAFDLVVSNVPFGDYKVSSEKRYRALNIHNYFVERSIDLTRRGGITAVITSHFTMDNRGLDRWRGRLRGKAELVGAVRLPKQAFEASAGTQVVTDILFFQRRAEDETPSQAEPAWERVVRGGPDNNIPMNEYFANNPDQMLGTPSMEGSMRGKGEEFTLDASGFAWEAALVMRMAELAKDVVTAPVSLPAAIKPAAVPVVESATGKPYGTIYEKDGTFYTVGEYGTDEPYEMVRNESDKKRMRGLMHLRDALTALREAEEGDADAAVITKRRKALNDAYDKFAHTFRRTVKGQKNQLGAIHAPNNLRLIEFDPEGPRLLAIEEWDSVSFEASKGPIFAERLTYPTPVLPPIETAEDALMRSLVDKGRPDPEYMEQLLGRNEIDQLADEGRVYYNLEYAWWETATRYLSGDIGQKIDKIEEMLSTTKMDAADKVHAERNPQALKEVLPEPLTAEQIAVYLGSSWIEPAEIVQFMKELLDSQHVQVRRTPLGEWTMTAPWGEYQKTHTEYGSDEMSAPQIILAKMNNRPLAIRRSQGEGMPTVVDHEKTAQVVSKAQRIDEAFNDWVWSDATRRKRLEDQYNHQFNRQVAPVYDGSHLRLPGLAADKTLRPHQLNAVWRIIEEGRL